MSSSAGRHTNPAPIQTTHPPKTPGHRNLRSLVGWTLRASQGRLSGTTSTHARAGTHIGADHFAGEIYAIYKNYLFHKRCGVAETDLTTSKRMSVD
jgi:hypothetical protein